MAKDMQFWFDPLDGMFQIHATDMLPANDSIQVRYGDPCVIRTSVSLGINAHL